MSLARLFLLFLSFGLLGFGGPVAQIALVRRRLIEREAWMPPDRFDRLLAVMQVLPGPEAHELCVHMGIRARGRWGGLVAGLGFMAPGFALMMGLAWFYFAIALDIQGVASALLAVQAAVLAVIVRAGWKIAGHVLNRLGLALLAVVALGLTLGGVSFWLVLPAAGAAWALTQSGRLRAGLGLMMAAGAVGLALAWRDGAAGGHARALVEAVTRPGSEALGLLFLSGLKVGLLTFGGAYTAIPVLRGDAERGGWLSDGQFLDSVALAQVIPAPLIIFATFVGYAAGGPWGGLAMTAGVFLPAFAFSMIFYDRLEAVVDNARLHAFLDGVFAGVAGLIAATVVQLGWSLWIGEPSARVVLAMVFLASLAAVWAWRSAMTIPAVVIAAGVLGAAAL
ncbi:chromate efflux transporter [Brevundimonas sp. S30B]|nr:chromate efflux transporter [Brevundimonas sp. MF30-B]TFW00600.1 chromate efflux transporter [Brevundimonas sp. S30B]